MEWSNFIRRRNKDATAIVIAAIVAAFAAIAIAAFAAAFAVIIIVTIAAFVAAFIGADIKFYRVLSVLFYIFMAIAMLV